MIDDEELARGYVRRAPAALAEVYRRHAAILCAVSRGTLGNEADAEDCVHDVLLRLWLSPDSYRIERGALRAYLIVCVRNEALSRVRSAARRYEADVRTMRASVACDERFEDRDHVELARLRAALSSLPGDQRRVIELSYFGDRSQTQIAHELGLPLGTIKGRAASGLRKLSLALGRRNPG